MSHDSSDRDVNRFLQRPAQSVTEMREQQASKIKEIGAALVATGFRALDKQADVLGLSRTTTWTILTGKHKGYGLSVDTLNRMLSARRLPPIVRAKINEYIREKAAGLYGDSAKRIRQFAALQSPTATKHRQYAHVGCKLWRGDTTSRPRRSPVAHQEAEFGLRAGVTLVG